MHEQPHVKAEAAAGGGRKASLYMGLLVRTPSPTRRWLGESGLLLLSPPAGNWSRFHLKRRRTTKLFRAVRAIAVASTPDQPNSHMNGGAVLAPAKRSD